MYKVDKENDKIYKSLLHKAQKANNTLKDTQIDINIEVPIPPVPYEKGSRG